MKTTTGILPALMGSVLGVAATVFFIGPRADAQAPAAAGPARYQVSAYSGILGGSLVHGCYIIDVASGELWQAQTGQQPQRVVEKLR